MKTTGTIRQSSSPMLLMLLLMVVVVLLVTTIITATYSSLSQRVHGKQVAGSVTSFRLIDAVTNQVIPAFDPLVEGAVIDLALLSTSSLNVEAIVTGTVASMHFVTLGSTTHVEADAPFALCGNDKADFFSCNFLREGFTGSVQATPFPLSNTSGNLGTPFSISFSIVRSIPPPILTLFDGMTNEIIGPLSNRTIIDLSAHDAFNVQAIFDPNIAPRIRSVVFTLDGTVLDAEDFRPFELIDSDKANFKPWYPEIGRHDILAEAFSHIRGNGDLLTSTSVVVFARPRIPTDDGYYDDDDEVGDDDDMYYSLIFADDDDAEEDV